MVCSPEMLASNRKNAARSTGPKTDEGKARSRRNALKHGLTGDGVVVPDEDLGAIQERFEAFEADLKPQGAVANYLVRRVALLSVRMDRSVRHESAEITRAMLGIEDLETEARRRAIVDLAAAVRGDDPAEAVRQLCKSPEGIDWLIGAWLALASDLELPRWTASHRERSERLQGRKPDLYGQTRLHALTEACDVGSHLVKAEDWPGLDPIARAQAARDELKTILAIQIDRLEREKVGLDHQAIARARATAPARALFDASQPAVLARKYEAAAAREFYKALKQVEHLDAREPAEEPPTTDDTNRTEETSSAESASFLPEPLRDRLAPARPDQLVVKGLAATPDRPQEGPRQRPSLARLRAGR